MLDLQRSFLSINKNNFVFNTISTVALCIRLMYHTLLLIQCFSDTWSSHIPFLAFTSIFVNHVQRFQKRSHSKDEYLGLQCFLLLVQSFRRTTKLPFLDQDAGGVYLKHNSRISTKNILSQSQMNIPYLSLILSKQVKYLDMEK